MAVRFKSCGNSADLVAELNRMQADILELRTQLVALLTKMDADFADVTNASTDYVSTTSPAALTQTGFTN